MSARDRVLALCDERGWYYELRRGSNVRVCIGDDTSAPPLTHAACGPTEEAACEALLAKLEPAPLPRLAPTLRGEVAYLVEALRRATALCQEHGIAYDCPRCEDHPATADDCPMHPLAVTASPAQREAWLAAFPDEPAGVRRPAYHEIVTGPDDNCDLIADPGDEDKP